MMEDVFITEISKEDERLDQVEKLFAAFYKGMQQQGLGMVMVDQGEILWRSSVEKTLGKFNTIVIAEIESEVVGFAWGSIKMAPNYLGSNLHGFVGGIYVIPNSRKKNIAKQMYHQLEVWFTSRKVHSFELQVLSENLGAMKFWEQCGFGYELNQMRKLNN